MYLVFCSFPLLSVYPYIVYNHLLFEDVGTKNSAASEGASNVYVSNSIDDYAHCLYFFDLTDKYTVMKIWLYPTYYNGLVKKIINEE